MAQQKIIFYLTILALIIVLPACSDEKDVVPGMADIPLQKEPPFGGTIFIDPDIVVASDPTAYVGLIYAGQGERQMFDRRVNDWINVNAHLFNATYQDGLSIEIQVNPEFSQSSALQQAERFGPIIGQLPTALRADLETVWIHNGNELFGGGNNNILIHTMQANVYIADGILEETLMHEASHTSLDANHAQSPGWINAQKEDNKFISTYARDNAAREDIAESFVAYFAIRFRTDRISSKLANTITNAIPNRIKYFDDLDLNMFPIE